MGNRGRPRRGGRPDSGADHAQEAGPYRDGPEQHPAEPGHHGDGPDGYGDEGHEDEPEYGGWPEPRPYVPDPFGAERPPEAGPGPGGTGGRAPDEDDRDPGTADGDRSDPAAGDAADDEDGADDAESGPAGFRTGPGRADRRRAIARIKRRRRRSTAREIPILVGVALLIALILKTFLVQAFVIPSGSMEQTIRIGDRVLVDKLTPWFGSTPHRGDVVVFRDPGHWLDGEPQPKPAPQGVRQVKDFFTFIGLLPAASEQDLIKRVIGVGGDRVQCCDPQGRIMVNGHALDEPYVFPGNPPSQIKFDVKVPPGRLWVMGDHRSNSADSRYHMNQAGGGTVAEDLVVGRAFVIAWPVSHWRTFPVPKTFGSVPGAGAQGMAAQDSGNRRQGLIQLPTPAELPLVMGVVGLHRVRGRRRRRSEEWKWGTWWSAHGPDPASPRGTAHRSARSRTERR